MDTSVILTVHRWSDRDRGVAEMKQVAGHGRVILTWELPKTDFWLTADYLPHFLAGERTLFVPRFRNDPDAVDIRPLAVPQDCSDRL